MAHLPDPVEDLDESLPASDPVVRAPKHIVVLPEPASYAIRTVAAIAMVGMLIGGSLGAVGIGIVYATQLRPSSRPRRAHISLGANGTATGTGLTATGGIALVVPDAGVAASNAMRPTGSAAGYTLTQQRLGRGRTFPAVLRSLGIASDLAVNIIRSLRGLVNMRSLQPSDVVVAMRDPDGNNAIRRVELRRSETQVWAVSIAVDKTCSAERIEVTKTSTRLARGFLVGDSLESTLRAAGLQADIVPRLQEVFTSLDLGRELRRGDTVRLIVEEERLNGVFFRYTRIEAVDYRGAMGRRRAFHQRLSRTAGEFFDAQGFSTERGPLRSPVIPARMTSPFNLRRMHPVLHRVMPHLGADFGAPVGTPVYAAADATVLTVGAGGPTGNLVRLSHTALGVETGYAHLSRFAPGLHTGMHVRSRQLIGYVGSTGRSTGPHLHWSLKRNGQFIDPLTMYGGRRAVPAARRAEFEEAVARLSAELDGLRVDGEVTPGQAGQSPHETDEIQESPSGAAATEE